MTWQSVVVAKQLRAEAPARWRVAKRWEGRDPEIVASDYGQRLRIRLLGGKESQYKSSADFLKSPEARGDRPEAVRIGYTQAAGRKTSLYRAEFEGETGSPEVPRTVRYKAATEFCIVAAGDRFYVLSYSATSNSPLIKPKWDGALWKKFLASFHPE